MIYGFEDYYKRLINDSAMIFKGNAIQAGSDDPDLKAVIISPEDMKLFYPFMSQEAIDMSRKGNVHSIGAIKTLRIKDGIDADAKVLGVLSFSVSNTADDESSARIRWIYVADSEREQGVGSFLIRSFLSCAKELKANLAFAEIEPDMENEPLAEFFAENGFDILLSNRAYLKIPAATLSKELLLRKVKYDRSCASIGEISAKSLKVPNWDFLDKDISCVLKAFDGEMLFLTGGLLDKDFNVDVFGPCEPAYHDLLTGMLLFAADGLLDKYGKGAYLCLESTDEKTTAFLSRLFKDHLITKTVKAVLRG